MIYLSDYQIREIQKCRENPVYFLETYGYLQHPVEGRIKWDLYDWQKALTSIINDNRKVVVLKSRQVGFSWIMAGYVLWFAAFYPNKKILLISQKESSAISLLSNAKYLRDNMPEWLIGEIGSDTKTEISFVFRDDNPDSETYGKKLAESMIKSLTTTAATARGEAASLVFCDEVAFWPWRESEIIWSSVEPTTSRGGKVILGSTPFGSGNLFDRLWHGAYHNKNGFIPVFIHYTMSGFDEEWLKEATAGLTKRQILQEYECEFTQSGSPVFDLVALSNAYRPDTEVRQTEMYFIGVDTSEGKGPDGDFNSAVVLNEYGEQVAAFNNQNSLTYWAGKMYDASGSLEPIPGKVSEIHNQYPGIMVVEYNSGGKIVAQMHKIPDKPNCRLVIREMTSKSKPLIMEQLALALENGKLTITDEETYEQLRVYQYKETGQMSAPYGMFDDLTVALAWAYEGMRMYGNTSLGASTLSSLEGEGIPLYYTEKFSSDRAYESSPKFQDYSGGDFMQEEIDSGSLFFSVGG